MSHCKQSVSQYFLSNNTGAATLFSIRRNAEKLIRNQFGDLNAQCIALLNKYNSAIVNTIHDQTAGGLMNSPIISNGSNREFNTFNVVGPTNLAMTAGIDLRSVIAAQSNIAVLATSLALTEYVLTNGISSSVSA